jgi:hypothetical protein
MNLPEYCKTCRFWVTESETGASPTAGECRRYPPPMFYDAKEQEFTSGEFPYTKPECWCGEWRPITPKNHEVT